MSLQIAINAATATLASAGVPSPRFDAEELAAHVLGMPRGQLPVAVATDAQLAELAELVDRRASRIPLQHLVGSVGFRYLEIPVGAGVFIPRPETETVVQAAIDSIRDLDAPICIDLCAGSGAIALSLAHELPGATVHAVEKDPVAFDWLRRNIDALGLPVTPHLADVAEIAGKLPELAGSVDLVVSNPPYVEADAAIDPEVAHDPALALWGGGRDGLDVIRSLVETARKMLRPQGFLVFEHSERQGSSAPAAAREAGFVEVEDHQDLSGRDRYVTARRPCVTAGLSGTG